MACMTLAIRTLLCFSRLVSYYSPPPHSTQPRGLFPGPLNLLGSLYLRASAANACPHQALGLSVAQSLSSEVFPGHPI